MAKIINLVKIASEKFGLGINESKMKVMVVDLADCLPVSTAVSTHRKVSTFVCLGSIIEEDGNSLAEICCLKCCEQISSDQTTRSLERQCRDLYDPLFFLFSNMPRKHGR